MQLYKKYLAKAEFDSLDDFLKNFKIVVPENFNFAYDVVDEYARIEPNKIALVWCNDEGQSHNFTY
ncbi:MAG TPA: acetyl-CoA synthetase, partial [Prolixibacteraceae bacterium]|nr:acetyl-CoA synthetase [Prolixibacteraceae bacterium]